MPRYFFTVRDSLIIPDKQGTDLPDEHAAIQEALRFAAKLMSRPQHGFWNGAVAYIDVSEGAGGVLFSVEFRVSESGKSRL